MLIHALLCSFPVSHRIPENLDSILAVLAQAEAGDLVLLPEGGLSGYCDQADFFDHFDDVSLHAALELLHQQVQQRGIHLWVGACFREQGRWFNAAWGFTPQGKIQRYHKVNLAAAERQWFHAGIDLPVFPLKFPLGEAMVGVQICRELRFPEQWGWLARQGAQVLLHLNNATGSNHEQPVWRSHLISRAAETQRFVLSVNNAAEYQKCPSMAISPDGNVLSEQVSAQPCSLRVELDLDQVSNWYLSQSRSDVVQITYTGWLDEMDN